MLDESVFTCQDAMEAIRADACDFISIYPGKNGGILRSMDIAQMAARLQALVAKFRFEGGAAMGLSAGAKGNAGRDGRFSGGMRLVPPVRAGEQAMTNRPR